MLALPHSVVSNNRTSENSSAIMWSAHSDRQFYIVVALASPIVLLKVSVYRRFISIYTSIRACHNSFSTSSSLRYGKAVKMFELWWLICRDCQSAFILQIGFDCRVLNNLLISGTVAAGIDSLTDLTTL